MCVMVVWVENKVLLIPDFDKKITKNNKLLQYLIFRCIRINLIDH